MIHKFKGYVPKINNTSFIANSAEIIGQVFINENASVWFGAILRGDDNKIYIGKGSNIQDNCVLHASEKNGIVDVGENVTVGHGAILHGCKISSNCLIGMGAIVLDGAEIGENTIIGAGSLITSNIKVPAGVLCMGSPGKVIRQLTEEEIMSIENSSRHYINAIKDYKNS